MPIFLQLPWLAWLVLAWLAGGVALGGEAGGERRYDPQQQVVVWGSHVGPYNNPHEVYPFEDLPVCELWKAVLDRKSVEGELLQSVGYTGQLVSSPRTAILFPSSNSSASGAALERRTHEICRMKVTSAVKARLATMIAGNYTVHYVVDDLPVVAPLGRVTDDGNKAYEIYTHKSFFIQRRNDQIVSVEMLPSSPIAVVDEGILRFTYDVVWLDSELPYSSRLHYFAAPASVEHKLHLFGCMNAATAATVAVALTLISMHRTVSVLKTRDSDLAFDDDDDLESQKYRRSAASASHLSGWALVSREVFRRPDRLAHFSWVVASGAHLVAALAATLLFLGLPQFPRDCGKVVALYAFTQPVGTWVAMDEFLTYGGQGWQKVVAWEAVGVPLLAALLFLQVNTVAIVQMTALALSAGTVVKYTGLFLLVDIPLAVGVAALHQRRQFRRRGDGSNASNSGDAPSAVFPCKVMKLRRPIPRQPHLHLVTAFKICAIGALSFACVAVEAHYLFVSCWTPARPFDSLGPFLFCSICALTVMVCATMLSVSNRLENENYWWHWHSVLCGSSLGAFVFFFAIWYYSSSATRINGLIENAFYWASTVGMVTLVVLVSGALAQFAVWRQLKHVYTKYVSQSGTSPGSVSTNAP